MSTKRLEEWYWQEENQATDWPKILADARTLEEQLAAARRALESQAIAHSNALQSLRYELYDAKQARPDRYDDGYNDGYMEGLTEAFDLVANSDDNEAVWRALKAILRDVQESRKEP